MKPARFAYHAPDTLAEALALLAQDGARVLAGGQSLVPMMNFRLAVPDTLVDIGRLDELRTLRVRERDGALEIGAGVTQARMLRERAASTGWPLLAEGILHVGHPQIRARGTVCGSLVHHDPTAELPALALALEATMTVASATGRRDVAAADFFTSYYQVALRPGEMLLSAAFPPLPPRAGWSFQELARRRGDFALVGSICVLRPAGDGTVEDCRLVLFGVAARPVRIAAAEEALRGERADGRGAARVAAAVADAINPISDIHAGGDYRRAAAAELAARSVLEAWERCADG